MECIYCGTENPDNAVFCKKCGRRLDGMGMCAACGKLTPADGEFCINCGANRNAPVYAPVERKSKISYSVKAQATSSAVPRAEGDDAPVPLAGTDYISQTASPIVSERVTAILQKLSLAFAAALAVISLIFVFLIGCTEKITAGNVSADTVVNGFSIFFFFGEAYQSTVVSDDLATLVTYGSAFGTICSIMAIAATVVCFLWAIVRVAKVCTHKTDKGVLVPCIATFFSFVCGSVLFALCMSYKTTVSSISTLYSLNGATVAGIVIGAILLVAAVATDFIAKGISGSVRSLIVNGVFVMLAAVFVLVTLGFAGSGVVFYSGETLGVDMSYVYGLYWFCTLLASSSTYNTDYASMCNTELALTAVLVIAVIIFCVLSIVVLSRLFADGLRGISDKTIRTAVVAGVFAIIYGVMMIVCTNVYISWIGDGYSLTLSSPIVAIFFGVLLVVAALAYKIVGKRLCAENGPETTL